MKIVRTDCEIQTLTIDATLRDAGHELVLLPDSVSEDALVDQVRDADLILMCYKPITARVIAAAERLKGIVKYGVGIDAIDIPAASARGIPVVNVPEYAEQTVAEGAFALMIALARRLHPLDRAMKEQGWVWPEPQWLGGDIAGKTVGLIGLGKIGSAMARMCGAGFLAKVIAYNPGKSADEMKSAGAEKFDDLYELLGESDFVSLHCVLTPETKGIIGSTELNAMKRSAYLINSSRGALVDELALLAALKDGEIAGAGLDVFSSEPLNRSDHPLRELYEMPNVILSPHLTFYTAEAMERLEQETLERCFEIIEGRKVLIKSQDPRLRSQRDGVLFGK